MHDIVWPRQHPGAVACLNLGALIGLSQLAGAVLRSFTNSLPKSEDFPKKTGKFTTGIIKKLDFVGQLFFSTRNVFELFSSKKNLFIFGIFYMNYKIAKRSKIIYVMSSIVSKTSASKIAVFFRRIFGFANIPEVSS